jgi:hypothetical protein
LESNFKTGNTGKVEEKQDSMERLEEGSVHPLVKQLEEHEWYPCWDSIPGPPTVRRVI